MYTQVEKSLIWLTMFNLSLNKANKVFNILSELDYKINDISAKKNEITNIVGSDIYSEMTETNEAVLNSYINNLNNKNIKCVTISSSYYPSKLKEIEEKPLVLFCKGDLSLFNTKSIAIVGTRFPSAYGRYITEIFAKKLAENNLTIISGLASGVDKISHEQALLNNGKTIAVLGGGFDKIYPAMNINLAKEIEKKGLLVSEYKPNISPTSYTFPFRNRIIAGLSDGVLITEAPERSGALHTKNYALEYGKEIFVVPGNINNIKGKGTNKILKSMQGACVTEPEDILFKIGINPNTISTKKVDLVQTNINEKLILTALEDGEQSLENLHDITKLETKILNSCLTILQIRGLIRKLPGNIYSIN
jgi:DNA processing protein